MLFQGELALHVVGDVFLAFIYPQQLRTLSGVVRWRRINAAAKLVPVDGADIVIIVVTIITIVMIMTIVSYLYTGIGLQIFTPRSSLLLLAATHDDSRVALGERQPNGGRLNCASRLFERGP